jgi:undecaprenyl-phosphate galactose phosphotransferase/putative colanic acid biosynthesis UDP-glucose lipid carrier transferase
MPGKRYSTRVKFVFQLNDLVVLNLSYFISTFVTKYNSDFLSNQKQIILILFLNLLWVILTSFGNIYAIRRVIKIDEEIKRSFFVLLFHFLITTLIVFFSKQFVFTTSEKISFYVIFATSLVFWKIISLKFLKLLRIKGFNYRKVVIIGGGIVGNQIQSFLKSDHSFGFQYLGVFDNNPNNCMNKNEVVGNINDFKTLALNQQIDEAFIALPNSAKHEITDVIRFCDANAIRIKIVPDFMLYIKPKVDLDFYGSIPIIVLHNEPLENLGNRFIKRSFDIIFSLFVVILILSWLIPLLAILIKIDSKGPVFFKQKRTGADNHDFDIIKLRSMKMNSDSDKVQARRGDKRVTRLGSFLRKSNLDELPQFFNVLIGNMSVIGPRPHMLEHTTQYSALIKGYMVRHFAKPGLTGWAQVNGLRGETKETEQMEARVQHDVYYIENWSIYLDNKIVVRTILNMLKGEENAF